MAAMTTVLTEFSDKENARTYSLSTHTVSKPNLVLQRRKVPSGNQVVIEDDITVLYATEDADGNVMPQKCSMTVSVRRPIGYDATDMTNLLATFRDIIAGDEFGNTVDTSEYLS
jgi:acetylornithine deacetylase/succinyl-diaminopimelate desuccinylase-like protein